MVRTSHEGRIPVVTQTIEIAFVSNGLVGTSSCQLNEEENKALQLSLKRLIWTPIATHRGTRLVGNGIDECVAIFVALVGEGDTMGHWGTVLSNAVLLHPPLMVSSSVTDDDSATLQHEHKAPSRRVTVTAEGAATLPCRLMLVKASRNADGGWSPLYAIDVDRKWNAPTLLQLDGATAVIVDAHAFLSNFVERSQSVHPMLTQRYTGTLRPQLIGRGVTSRVGSGRTTPGRALVLTLYGVNPRHNFDAAEWRGGLDSDVIEALPEQATSLFDIVDVELQATRPAKRWVVPPTTTTALFASSNIVSASSSPQRVPPTVTNSAGPRKVRGQHAATHAPVPSGELHQTPEHAHISPPRATKGAPDSPCSLNSVVLEPLRAVPVLSTSSDCRATDCQPGVDPSVTAQWWTMTLDLDALSTGWTPVVVLASAMRQSSSMLPQDHVRVPLLPDLFSDHTTGTFTIPVWVGSVVTALHVQYVEVTSFVHPANHAARVRSDEGLHELTLDTLVGHRGLGKTYTSSDATVMQQKLAENSLESFSAAHARGCQWVELDVMMTKDYVPILFHDAILQVAARGKQRTITTSGGGGRHDSGHRAGMTPYDTLPVAVHQLTYRQLNNALTRTYQQEDAAAPSGRLRELLIKHWLELLDIAAGEGHRKADPMLVSPLIVAAHRGSGSSTAHNHSLSSTPKMGNSLQTPRLTCSSALLRRIDDLADFSQGQTPPIGEKLSTHLSSPPRFQNRNSTAKQKGQFVEDSKHQRFITNHIPTLQELFDTTPPTLRVNLEVKFPFQPKADHHLYLQTHHFEVNDFVDAILTVVFDHVQQFPKRELVFSSFEPDVCIALMLKQCRFHVLFLSDTEEHVDLKDYRSHTVETAIQFAHGHHMSGISIYGLSLLDEADKQWQTPASNIKTWARELEKRSRVASMDDIHSMILSASATDHGAVDNGNGIERSKVRHCDAATPPPQAMWSSEKGRRVVKCSHAHALKVWTWGDRNSDPIFAFVQSREMLVDAVISDNVPLWSNASVGKLQSRPPSGTLDVLAT
jgi:glycerophosphoryl diester phosphodiesterase